MAGGKGLGREEFARMAAKLPVRTDPASVRRRIEAMEHLLERSIKIPGINYRIGLDVALDLLPIGGTTIGAIMGGYMLWEARNLGMGKGAMLRMSANVAFDWLLGLIPWIGAVPDLFFRSNTRNLRIIRRHLDRHHPSTVVIDQG
ncbi:DUF4112 domain-containing protein [Sphingomonas sp. BGYR3]|uniref:DUF4112 domain-containing protein n=1 Tax=Sphingomonas sp. BGYR3 TaxID=2975483 RepID=UPI0021A54ADC|nr:DUF4112 domain-containing protein [Sphingomonas sp. BGYR3]MDG5488270.1 DUF4112 domain-containing protein [Sphingomonas sp. BGYR3]